MHRRTDRTTTVTLAAHARRGLIMHAHARCICTLTHQFAVTARNNSLILSLSCNEQLAASGGTNSITLLLKKRYTYIGIYIRGRGRILV